MAVVAGLLTAALGMVASPPAGAGVSNPGPLQIEITGGVISLNNGEVEIPLGDEAPPPGPGDPILDPVTLTGTIQPSGEFLIPAAAVSFPSLEVEAAPGLLVDVSIIATTDVVGFINPDSGNARAGINLAVILLPQILPVECRLFVPMDLSTTTAGGTSYDPTDGTASLADTTFEVPSSQATVPSNQAFCDGAVNAELGLPAAAGTNSAVLNIVTDPILEGDGDDTDPDISIPTPTTTTTTAPPPPPATEPPATTAPPAAAPAEGYFLPQTSITPRFECRGADAETTSLLELLGGTAVEFSPVVTFDQVAPSPEQGQSFTASFRARFDLPAEVIDEVVALGINQASLSNLEMSISAREGVEGPDVVMTLGLFSTQLVAGQGVGTDIGPFQGTFTRTSAVGQPISFTVGDLTVTLSAIFGGAEVALNLACTPVADNVLTVVDVLGTPPPVAAEAPRQMLPATGSSSAPFGALAVGLLLAGVLMLLASKRIDDGMPTARHLA